MGLEGVYKALMELALVFMADGASGHHSMNIFPHFWPM